MPDAPHCSAEQAAALLDIEPKELARFDHAPDLFNRPNTLSGWLCRRGDHRYGALVIDAVSGLTREPPFVVYGTPKQRYPFGRTEDEERRYHWPEDVSLAVAYEKLDGTNILGYCYPFGGQCFFTYKTRLTPTLRASSRHGDFFGLWSEVLEKGLAGDGPEAYITPNLALSFELWGHRNHHLISYEEPLAATLLFGVDQERAVVLPPDRWQGLRQPEVLAQARGRAGLTEFYEKLRDYAETKNRSIDDDHMEGTEGAVLYLEDAAGGWTQWKAKPESVEALHWAGDFIPESVILPTAWNALESCEELTTAGVSELLREEFSEAMVRNSIGRIEKAVERVLTRLAWRERVREAYAATGLRFEDGKGAVMRSLSMSFPKAQMREVFNALRELGIAS